MQMPHTDDVMAFLGASFPPTRDLLALLQGEHMSKHQARRGTVVVAMASAGMLLTAVPALAQTVQGSRDCGSRFVGIVSSTGGSGTTEHYYGTGQYFSWANPTGYTTRSSVSSAHSTTWKVIAYSISSASSTCYS
jgi:hypothetical protein